jgi:hypothetical protein
LLQDRYVTYPLQSHGVEDIKQRQALEHLVNDPDLLLGDGGGQRLSSWRRHNRGDLLALLPLKSCLDTVGQTCDRWCQEEAEQGYLDIHGLA